MKSLFFEYFRKLDKTRVIILLIPMIFSFYILICSGWFAQAFLTFYGFQNCYECALQPEYLKNFFWTTDSALFLFPCLIIYGGMFFFKKRIYNYLLMVCIVWSGLLFFDILNNLKGNMLTLGNVITNVIYDLVGAITLSFFICIINTLLFHLVNSKTIPVFLSLIIPVVTSIAVAIIICANVYLFYAKEPLSVEATLSDNALFAYESSEKNNSFGFLNNIETSTSTDLTTYKKSDYNYLDSKGKSDLYIYLITECLIDKDKIKKIGNVSTGKFRTVKNLNFSYPYITSGFVTGNSITINTWGSKQLQLLKNIKDYGIISLIRKDDKDALGELMFRSRNHPITLGINFYPVNGSKYIDNYEAVFKINDESYKINVNLKPASINSEKKKTECKYTQIKPEIKEYTADSANGVGVLVYIKPNEVIDYSYMQKLSIRSEYATLQKNYKEKKDMYSEISNGVLAQFSGRGLDSLKLNNKVHKVDAESEIMLSGNNLVAYISNQQSIKISGLADVVALNNKAMNLRKISAIREKLSTFDTSFTDVVKWIFSIGFFSLIVRFIFSYFRSEKVENLFLI